MFHSPKCKKLSLFLLDTLVFLSLGGTFYLHRLSEKKLGMIRWINFQSQRLERFVSLPLLRAVSVLLVLGLCVLLLWLIRTLKPRRFVPAFLLCPVCAGLFLFLLFAFQRKSLPSYYFLLAMNALAFFFAWLRWMLEP